jgi:hypothetical protein
VLDPSAGVAAVGNFTGDAAPDIAAGNDEPLLQLFINDGAGAFPRRVGLTELPWPRSFGDLNGDGILDMAGAQRHGEATVFIDLIFSNP